MKLFSSPFEKLSSQSLQNIETATRVTAESVSPGGALFGKIEEMIGYLKKIEKNTSKQGSPLTGLDKATLKLIGPAAQGIAEAFKIIIDAVVKAPPGEEMDKKISAVIKGMAAVVGLGKAIFQFAGMLALSLPLLIIGMAALPLAMFMILAVAGVFWLVQKMGIDKTIKSVATGLAIAGLAIISLAAGIVLAEMILSYAGNPVGTFLTVSGLILGISAVMAIAGIFSPFIRQGAISIALVGLALIPLALGMLIFSAAVPPTLEGWNSILQVNALIISLGTVMALAGLASEFIIPGAIAIGIAGLALVIVAGGLAAIAAVVKPGKFDYLLADSGHETTGFLGFGGGRMMSNMEWMLQSIAFSFLLPPHQIASLYATAPAMILAGTALVMIAKGIEKFQALDIDYEKFPDQMSKVVNVLATGFAEVGRKYPGGGGGFVSAIFGAGSGTSDVAQGISAVGGMGRALTGVAQGVQAMAMLKFPTKWDKNGNPVEFRELKDEDFDAVSRNTQRIVAALSSTFGKIGSAPEAADPWGWFGHSKIEEGMQIVGGIGSAIANLAAGVQGVADFKLPIYGTGKDATKIIGYKTLNDAGVLDVATQNIQKIVAALSSTFGKIGANPDAEDTWGWFGNSNVEEGIEIVSKIANPIVGLVGAIKKIAELDQSTFDTAEGKISSILAKSSSLFANATQSGWTASELEDAADAFEDMADSMDDWKDAVNALDLKKVTEVRKLYEGLAYLAKNDGETAIEKMGSSLVEALNHLSELLEKAGSGSGGSLLDKVFGGREEAPPKKPGTGAEVPGKENNKSESSAISTAELKKLAQILQSGIDVRVVNDRF